MKILIVSRQSKYEWEVKNYNLSHKGFIDKYNSEHSNLKDLLASHYGLIKTRDMFKSIMPDANIMTMDNLTSPIKDYDLVISLGGDDSFKYISHYVGNIPMLSVNSDPKRSVGELTSFQLRDINSVLSIKHCLESNNFKIKEWVRLKMILNGLEITPAISEYFLGDYRRNKMSTHTLIHNNNEVKQRCSGLIIATGAGSTGWFKSASVISPYSPLDRSAWFVATELYSGDELEQENFGFIKQGDELTIRSMNNEGGIVSVDSWKEHRFIRGDEAIISLGNPLKVIILNESI